VRLKFINYPHFIPLSDYEDAVDTVVRRIIDQPGVLSVYQVGSINTPGISDIDLLVVFKDGINCFFDPLKRISRLERYLFTHSLYGASETHFCRALSFPFFHDYHHLWGQKLHFRKKELPKREIDALEVQTALEYLMKAFISLTVELTYKIVKVRGLLLHTKALLYDLEFLGVFSGELYDLTHKIVSWRDDWFEKKPGEKKLTSWIESFYTELASFLKHNLKKRKFLLPEWANFHIARNMTLVPWENFKYVHKGIALPSIFGALGRKYFNIQHRFNKFMFYLPVESKKMPVILKERFLLLKEKKDLNRAKLPHFVPTSSGLNIIP
jgi:hypothetical protein